MIGMIQKGRGFIGAENTPASGYSTKSGMESKDVRAIAAKEIS
jgi:hypothetical protein